MKLVVAAGFAALAAVSDASAAPLHEVVADLRRSEQSVRAAAATNDRAELIVQRRQLAINFRHIAGSIDASEAARMNCTLANQTLLNMVLDLELPAPRASSAWEADDLEFRKHIASCERLIGRRR